MIRLPPPLERRLSAFFPRIRERERFVADTVERAVEELEEYERQRNGDDASSSAPVHHEAGIAGEDDLRPSHVGGALHLFTDGGSRGNPGEAAIAGIIEDPLRGIVVEEFKERIGRETNNVAEYRALIEGLQRAKRFQPSRLVCHLDSELIVRQLNGQYQVKMQTLKVFYDQIKQLTSAMSDVIFVHIPRQDNYRADALVNRALDELPAPSRPARPPPQSSLFAARRTPLSPGDVYRSEHKR